MSTIRGIPFDFANSAIAGISATKRFGLLGDSTCISFVFGVIAFSHSSILSGSTTQFVLMPILGNDSAKKTSST